MRWIAFVLCLSASAHAQEPINAVIGDESWLAQHATAPKDASEVARIRTHLFYVVERLRAHSFELPPLQRERRERALDALTEYAEAGVFPRRTKDDYGARRPRFIDDRGVHCAVGELVRRSGHPALARAIRDRWEYAYISEIRSPELLYWAREHGFTVRELAMIQPSYDSPPTAGSVRREIESGKDHLTITCARQHEPPSSIQLSLRGDAQGAVVVAAAGRSARDPFARCFAQRVDLRGGGAWDGRPTPFDTMTQVSITAPQVLLEQRIREMHLHGNNTNCIPRPGAVPRMAFVLVRVDGDGLGVAIRTDPRNPEVDACLTDYLRQRLRAFGAGRWSLEVRARKPLGPTMSEARLRELVANFSAPIIEACRDDDEALRVRVDVRARVSEELAIEVKDGSETFRECVTSRLRQQLRTIFQVPRRFPDGTAEQYYGSDIDADVSYAYRLR